MSLELRAYICASVVAGVVALASAPAMADESSATAVELQLDVSLDVARRCGFASGGAPTETVDLGQLKAGGSAPISFALDCNTPFRFRAASAYGALRNSAVRLGDVPDGMFTRRLPYTLDLALGVRRENGNTRTITRSCRSQQLAAGGNCSFQGGAAGEGIDTNDGVAIAGDTGLPSSGLTVSWEAPEPGDPVAVAGTYSDVITISVEVAS
jgi:hypothetical protein